MKQIVIILLFLNLVNVNYSQKKCDTVTVNKIVNLQLKIADKQFNRPYILLKTTKLFKKERKNFKTNSVYNRSLCKRYMTWDNLYINSKFGIVKTDTTKDLEYTCFISTPMFNKDKTKCRVMMSVRHGEWGGHGSLYFYEKKGGLWKFVRTGMIWIS
ncbi:MAG: hypothetical protein ABFS35_13965 [Bacteroidota bacterium]